MKNGSGKWRMGKGKKKGSGMWVGVWFEIKESGAFLLFYNAIFIV